MQQEFQTSFRRLLVPQQRRAVLEALASSMPEGATVGDVIDAARSLGWSEPMGTFTLQDLADALLPTPDVDEELLDGSDDLDGLQDDAADEDLDPANSDGFEPEPEPEPKPTPAKTAKKKKAAAKATPPAAPAKAAPKAKATKARKGSARLRMLRAKLDADERMSLDEAAEVLVPIVSELEPATMQSLEEFTGIGRRKLRFHIGQLVRHEYLERHGMGRGTYYTACE